MRAPLRTLKGSRIQRHDPVGKRIGTRLYVHRNYAHLVTPPRTAENQWNISAQDMLQGAKELAEQEGFEFNCVVFDAKDPAAMRLDQVPRFDTEREPVVGNYMWVYPLAFKDNGYPIICNGKPLNQDVAQSVIARGHSNGIWHHKWTWVLDEYAGFDVQEAWEWSRTWLGKVKGRAKGTQKTWLAQLIEAGLP